VLYTGRGGEARWRSGHHRVTHASVLGPLHRDLTYATVLQTLMPSDTALMCCADDTLVLVLGVGGGRTICLVEMAVACVVVTVRELGLVVFPKKTQALWFRTKANHGMPAARYALSSWRDCGRGVNPNGVSGSHTQQSQDLRHPLRPSDGVDSVRRSRPRQTPLCGAPMIWMKTYNQQEAMTAGNQYDYRFQHHLGGGCGGSCRTSPVRTCRL
jgi:hypothetical protein